LAGWDDAFTRAAQSSLRSPSLRAPENLAHRMLAKMAVDQPSESAIDRLKGDSGLRIVAISPSQPPRKPTRMIAAAAALLVLFGLTSTMAMQGGLFGGTGSIGRLAYRSSVGLVVADAALSRGQLLELNADTALHLDDTRITSLLRRDSRLVVNGSDDVTLSKGSGVFRVVPKSGPFAVRAGDVTVRVVGTRFGVERRDNGQIDVTVYEGEVSVETAGTEVSLREGETWNAKDGRRTTTSHQLPPWAQQLLTDWNAANWAMSFPSAAPKNPHGVTP